METGLAAINAGADAVYIGASQFGARESASNAPDAIAQLTRYAHQYWARVYVTVNTLLFDQEIPQAVDLIHRLYQMGVDAVIIQDVGLLECDLPPIPLFASTQMHNHTPARVKFLEDVGFKRVILARELSLKQIHAIRLQTTIGLESFVHGALCVSYSGQCAMSYALGGRSGNRGQCAQPCRKLYRLVDGAGKTLVENSHLLSLHDLNLSAYLPELLAAGVRSFKIEGSLKDKAYVTNIVSFYRRALDQILPGMQLTAASSGHVDPGFNADPQKTFNRGYTSYFIQGRGAEKIGANLTPKWVGEPVGSVTRVDPQSFMLDSDISLHTGDGLTFFDPDRELSGTVVNRANAGWITPDRMGGIQPGLTLYRNHDRLYLAALEKQPFSRKINLTFRLEEAPHGFILAAEDEDGCRAEQPIDINRHVAIKPDQAIANIRHQLEKLGGTDFECQDVIINFSQPYFLTTAVVNAARRDVIDKLSQVRQVQRFIWRVDRVPNAIPFPDRELGYSGNVLNQKAYAFYRRHGVTKIQMAAESGLDMHGLKVMTTKYCLRDQYGWCLIKNKADSIKGPLSLVDEQGTNFPLRFNCKACEMEVYLGLK